jgi:hypothetical protein
MGEQTPDYVTNPPARRVETYRKRARAAELRRAGWRWDDIAAEVGYADKAVAFRAVEALMNEERELGFGEVSLYRAEQLDRYNALLKAAWEQAEAGSKDHLNAAVRILTRIDKLTGAEAPIKHEFGESDVDRAIRELDAEIRRRSAEAARQIVAGQDPQG